MIFADPDGVMIRTNVLAIISLVCSSLDDFSLFSRLFGMVTTSTEFSGTVLKMDLKSRVNKQG
jgi:hypothetical protein